MPTVLLEYFIVIWKHLNLIFLLNLVFFNLNLNYFDFIVIWKHLNQPRMMGKL